MAATPLARPLARSSDSDSSSLVSSAGQSQTSASKKKAKAKAGKAKKKKRLLQKLKKKTGGRLAKWSRKKHLGDLLGNNTPVKKGGARKTANVFANTQSSMYF